MSIEPVEDPNSILKRKLEHYVHEIRLSYFHDLDKTDEITNVTNFIKTILESDEPLESHFNNNDSLLKFFMTGFLKNIISNILSQNMINGDNGDDIAVDLIYHIYKLFLKFHKETKYTELFETIREMIQPENSLQNFFKNYTEQRIGINTKIENVKRKFNSYNFNQKFCKEYIDKTKEPQNIYKRGDKVDILIQNKHSRNLMDRKVWIRGVIQILDEENMQYIVKSEELNEIFSVQMGGGEIVPQGEKTKDWEWRLNLQKYEVIDCFDRNKWYPSTITSVKENNKLYHVGFRLYPKYFKNKEDENDKYENYQNFWVGQKLFLDNIFFFEKNSKIPIVYKYSKKIYGYADSILCIWSCTKI